MVRALIARASGSRVDSSIAEDVQRLTDQAVSYGVVGSLVLSWSWAKQSEFTYFCMHRICPSSPRNSSLQGR